MKPDIQKYFAFISYSSLDLRWGKRLQRKLEHYKMPATLCSEKGWARTPLRPVFFAPTDIQPGELTVEIQDRLRASRNLIVICSPNSAQSEWVGKEIAFFQGLGRAKDIHFFIIDGIPHSGDQETECFNPIIKRLGLPEILAANINEKIFRWGWLNKERAYIQLISKLLCVEFDSIWKRHRRILVQKTIACLACLLLMVISFIGVWANTKPIDINVRLNETSYHNDQLPQLKEAIVILELANEVKIDTVHSLDAPALFTNIPHKFLNENVRIKVLAGRDFFAVDTVALLQKDMSINIRRDPSRYGDVQFILWDPVKIAPIKGASFIIAGREVVSDENGKVQLYIPLALQNTHYHIISDTPIESDTLGMPCNDYTIIEVKQSSY